MLSEQDDNSWESLKLLDLPCVYMCAAFISSSRSGQFRQFCLNRANGSSAPLRQQETCEDDLRALGTLVGIPR